MILLYSTRTKCMTTTKMSKTDVAKIQSRADITGKNKDFAIRSQSAADKHHNKQAKC